MSGWLKYIEAIVTHYKTVVNEWEIWNEPNNGNKDTEVYASLLIQTAEVIRKVQPDAKIIGFALYKMPLDYTRGVLDILKEKNKLELINYLSYHPYSLNPDESYVEVDKLNALVQSYNPEIKLFQGENGCPAALEFGHALKDYPWTEISQAKWSVRRMTGDRVRDIRTSVFTMIDLKYSNMLQSFGLIRSNLLHKIIYKKPSFYGVQHMAAFFDDNVKPVGELKYQSHVHFYAYDYREMTVGGFIKNDTPVTLVWYNDRIPGDEMKWDLVDITIEGINNKYPVYVEMISGKVYEIN